MKKLLLLTAILFCTVPVAAQEAELRDSLKEVLVTAVREKMRNTTQTGLMRFEGKQLRSGVAVFGTPDIIKKLQMLPGVAAGNELMSGLYVHGGDGTDNLFLLDGIPLYNISHFGGLFSSFNTDIVDNLDFYKSGFPARYGGRLSSVVDVETREGSFEKYHGSVSIGMIDGRLQFEGPIVKNKTSFNLALRRTWMDVVTLPAIAYANLKYGGDQVVGGGYAMWDANARLTHKFSEDNVLNACFYMGQDNLHFSLKQKEDGVDGNSLKMGVKWGSLTASVSHNYKYSNKLRSRHVLYYSRSNSDTGYDFLLGTAGSDGSATSMTDSDVSGVQELGARSDWDWFPNSWNHVRYGLSLQYHWYDSGRKFLTTMVSGGEELSRSEGDESLGYRAFEPAIYIEDEIFIRHNLSANLGLRYALFQTGRKVWHSPEPRVALKWMPHPIVSAKVSYTRMSQFAHLVSAMYIDLPSNCWMPSTEEVRPMMSDQVAGGIYLTPYKDVKLNVEGWYKTMDYILTYNGGNSFVPPITGWEKTFSEGRGRSWGMEVEATYDNGKLAFST
ncbi:MAG: TonB-dependent receptor plug domain-containing protein, partial [Bacteroidales bacterium]|nr:TonB-dependent receptor plug domain-containing protein [Bacteroidales bacterium]